MNTRRRAMVVSSLAALTLQAALFAAGVGADSWKLQGLSLLLPAAALVAGARLRQTGSEVPQRVQAEAAAYRILALLAVVALVGQMAWTVSGWDWRSRESIQAVGLCLAGLLLVVNLPDWILAWKEPR